MTTTPSPPSASRRSFADVFHSTAHRQSVCMLAVLTWVAACDGRISTGEQALLDAIAASVDDREELAAVQAAVVGQNPKDLEIACRFLRNQLDRGGKRLLVQLAITTAIHDGNLTVGENHLLQFLADLLGLSPRAFARLFQQMAHRPFPQSGDPSSPKWWRGRAAGEQAGPAEFALAGDVASADAELADEPMIRGVALGVLGLDTRANSQSIHAAYRRLAKTRHPDRFSPLGPAAVATATEAFKRLHDAYSVLSA